jgi:hypothetical protein
MDTGKRTRWSRWLISFALAVCLHAAPAWFVIYGHLYGLPNVLEIDLEKSALYRDRVFREMERMRAAQKAFSSLQVSSVVTVAQLAPLKKVSSPRSEDDTERVRAVQRAIRELWDGTGARRPGYALVSMNVLESGYIGDCVINRVAGDEEFKTFLVAFLNALKGSSAALTGPGEALWIECEFVVQPMARKDAS